MKHLRTKHQIYTCSFFLGGHFNYQKFLCPKDNKSICPFVLIHSVHWFLDRKLSSLFLAVMRQVYLKDSQLGVVTLNDVFTFKNYIWAILRCRLKIIFGFQRIIKQWKWKWLTYVLDPLHFKTMVQKKNTVMKLSSYIWIEKIKIQEEMFDINVFRLDNLVNEARQKRFCSRSSIQKSEYSMNGEIASEQ